MTDYLQALEDVQREIRSRHARADTGGKLMAQCLELDLLTLRASLGDGPAPQEKIAGLNAHWSKDPNVPYPGCKCATCNQAASPPSHGESSEKEVSHDKRYLVVWTLRGIRRDCVA